MAIIYNLKNFPFAMLLKDFFYSPFSGILNITHDSHSTSHGQVDDILMNTKRIEMIQEKIKGGKSIFKEKMR